MKTEFNLQKCRQRNIFELYFDNNINHQKEPIAAVEDQKKSPEKSPKKQQKQDTEEESKDLPATVASTGSELSCKSKPFFKKYAQTETNLADIAT